MRLQTHAQKTERVALPRRLVPRRPSIVEETLAAIKNGPLEWISEGDIITFECADRWHHVITILRIHPYGAIDVMVYDGQPHHLPTTCADLIELNIVRRERMEPEDVAGYCRQLGLDAPVEVAA